MKRLYCALVLMLTALSPAESSLLLYPQDGCGFFMDAAVEGIYVEDPDIGFYGLVNEDDTPAVVYDPSFLTARYTGTVGYRLRPNTALSCLGQEVLLYASTSYFQCSGNRAESLDGQGLIQLWGIEGGGIGGILPSTQTSLYSSCIWESHTEAMIGGVHRTCYGFDLFSAIGFGYLYRHQDYVSQLINFEIGPGFNNGTITEDLNTQYRGVVVELGATKELCDWLTFSLVPRFGIYHAHTEFKGLQTWGSLSDALPLQSVEETKQETAYQAGLRGALLFNWCDYYIGGQAFMDYLSYVPGVFNPREDDQRARIVGKNSLRFGGGVVLGKAF